MNVEPMPEIVQGDARRLPLPDESIDLVVTSPPYSALRDYGVDGQLCAEATPSEFIDALVECTREMVRVPPSAGRGRPRIRGRSIRSVQAIQVKN